MSSGPVGRILQVNISSGGVPKRPVAEAWVGRFGLEGDGHAEPTVHGGPHRAVCLFGIEAIRRVAAEGHPIAPGSCGENLTTEGLELGLLPVGTRLAIGERLVLELSKPVTPCATIAGSFADGRFGRISPVSHPSDARMYARVLVEGPVRPGDSIRVLPPAAESEASRHLLLERIEAAERLADVARWRTAEELGWPIEVVDDGDLAMAASTALEGPAFNWVDGLRALPHLLDRALDYVRAVGAVGWLPLAAETAEEAALPSGAHPVSRLDVFAVEPERIRAATHSDGLVVRGVRRGEEGHLGRLLTGVGGLAGEGWQAKPAGSAGRAQPGRGERAGQAGRLAPIFTELARSAHHDALVALAGSELVGGALLVTRRRVGLLRNLAVAGGRHDRPAIEAALLHAVGERTVELGCDLVAAVGWLGEGSPADDLALAGVLTSETLARAGLVQVGERLLVRFDPHGRRDGER